MKRLASTALALAITGFLPATASAHAFLDSAMPPVGGTVRVSPSELRLSFTQKVVVALCRVTLASENGSSIAVGKPVGDASTSTDLRVALNARLAPGSYRVTWRVVSIDTHPTSASFRFTVAP